MSNTQNLISPTVLNYLEQTKNTESLDVGINGMKDLLAPPSYDFSNADYVRIDDTFVKSFSISDYPEVTHVRWLEDIFHYDGDMDVNMSIVPADTSEARKMLNKYITQNKTQLMGDLKRGSIADENLLRNKIGKLEYFRDNLERGIEKMFYTNITFSLFEQNESELLKNSERIQRNADGKSIDIDDLTLRQDAGYLTMLPIGKNYLTKEARLLTTGGLVSLFPFYQGNVYHPNGVMVGENLRTNEPVLIDFFDHNLTGGNSNTTVFARSGKGKTFFVRLLTLRNALDDVQTVIIDPEDEYKDITEAVEGSYVKISPTSDTILNPFDLEAETDEETGEVYVDIDTKVVDILNLTQVMSGGAVNEMLRAGVMKVIRELYTKRGFTRNPDTLYVPAEQYDPETGRLVGKHEKLKDMPTISEFIEALEDYSRTTDDTGAHAYMGIAQTLKTFRADSVGFGLFDGQTSKGLRNLRRAPIITFNIKELEGSILRPVGMYVVLNWAWEKFGKKNNQQKKVIVCDEAWMLTKENSSAEFLENTSRRARKRNTGLFVVSQNFKDFKRNQTTEAVLTNSSINIFLGQDTQDLPLLQSSFNLSEGELNFLGTADRGEMLIRLREGTERVTAKGNPNDIEMLYIEPKLKDKLKEYQRMMEE